ncbi:MAG: NAD(P)-binding domain-containing protein [Candidatus Liptonbacteria bacterium]|nr:NAD(P)-binding domain-containing protein [Candidatus Liptonbacteria bacterium]
MPTRIVILGAGDIGRALAVVLEQAGHGVLLWDKDPQKVPNQKPLSGLVPQAEVIFICVPSWALREVLIEISPFLPYATTVVSLTKGIEVKSQKLADEVMCELLSRNRPFAVLGGPLLAEEIVQGLQSVGVVASNNRAVYDRLAAVSQGTQLMLEYSSHVHQIALAGVLKNIYSLMIGVADGLAYGSNTKGWLVAQATHEMTEIFAFFRYPPAVILSTAGLGDLIATAFSPYSRNRKAGNELARTGTIFTTSEGIVSLPPMLNLLGEGARRLPLLQTLRRIVIEKQPANQALTECLSATVQARELE